MTPSWKVITCAATVMLMCACASRDARVETPSPIEPPNEAEKNSSTRSAGRAVKFPLANSSGIEPSATEIRVIRKGERFTFLGRNTTYTEALQLLAVLAGKKVILEGVPKTPVVVESRDTTPDEAFVALLMSSKLSYKVRSGVYHVTAAK